jgi:hypothetical protein
MHWPIYVPGYSPSHQGTNFRWRTSHPRDRDFAVTYAVREFDREVSLTAAQEQQLTYGLQWPHLPGFGEESQYKKEERRRQLSAQQRWEQARAKEEKSRRTLSEKRAEVVTRVLSRKIRTKVFMIPKSRAIFLARKKKTRKKRKRK